MNKKLIDFLVNAILSNEVDYELEEVKREDGSTLVRIKVEPKYVGKLIGKDGRTARAIHTLISLQEKDVFLEISEK